MQIDINKSSQVSSFCLIERAENPHSPYVPQSKFCVVGMTPRALLLRRCKTRCSFVLLDFYHCRAYNCVTYGRSYINRERNLAPSASGTVQCHTTLGAIRTNSTGGYACRDVTVGGGDVTRVGAQARGGCFLSPVDTPISPTPRCHLAAPGPPSNADCTVDKGAPKGIEGKSRPGIKEKISFRRASNKQNFIVPYITYP